MDEFPIDPALSGTFDPILRSASPKPASFIHLNGNASTPTPNSDPGPSYFYDQAPEGDPFAFHHIDQSQMSPPPQEALPSIRKRRSKITQRRECQQCHGDDNWNSRTSAPEDMAICIDCLKCWHPSCTNLPPMVSESILHYEWTCQDCKRCVECNSKSRPAQMMLCESCDRGCHRLCTQPPLTSIPDGPWYCSRCPDPSGTATPTCDPDFPMAPLRASSAASSSHTTTSPVRRRKPSAKGGKTGRPRSKNILVSDDGSDDEPKATLSAKRKGKARAIEPPDEDELSESPARRRPRESLPRIRIRPPRDPTGKPRKSDESEPRKGIFEDFLPPEDRDTTKTSITGADKNLFERSRIRAEEKMAPPAAPLLNQTLMDDIAEAGPSRPLRSRFGPAPTTQSTSLSVSPGPSTPGPSSIPMYAPGTLRIKSIRFGQYDIKTWYNAPFPEEYASIPDGRLWICEFCLKYMKSGFGMERHRMKCKARHPPGDEIYRDGRISVFEVDGRRNKIYCQNLCLLSKMFLDHKSLFYDVEPFLFYVITEMDRDCSIGAHFIGYFSKEKRSPMNYNLSCIMTLPVRQRQGWGNFLMDFSYLLSKKEELLGSPEKPLSSLGALSYRTYWTLAIMRYFETAPVQPRLDDICAATSMTKEDAYSTLSHLNMIVLPAPHVPTIRPSPGQAIRISRGRGRGIARKNLVRTISTMSEWEKSQQSDIPFKPPPKYCISFDCAQASEHLRKWESKGYLKLQPEKLQWSPFLLGRIPKTEFTSETNRVADLITSDSVPEGDGSVLDDTSSPRQSSTPSLYSLLAPTPSRDNTPRTTTPRKRRGRPSRASSVADSLALSSGGETDEALAAKLAAEEELGPRRRTTRSASGIGLDARKNNSHTPSPSPSKTSTQRRVIPSRKRRRVESSEEPEEPDDHNLFAMQSPSETKPTLQEHPTLLSDTPIDTKTISALRSRPPLPLPTPNVDVSSHTPLPPPPLQSRGMNGHRTSSASSPRLNLSSIEPEDIHDDGDPGDQPLQPATLSPFLSPCPPTLNIVSNGRSSVPSGGPFAMASEVIKMDVDTPSVRDHLMDATINDLSSDAMFSSTGIDHVKASLISPDPDIITGYSEDDIEMCDEDAEGEIDEEFYQFNQGNGVF